MLFMIIETFKKEDVPKIYARLAEQGRMMPSGLEYVDSWVATDHTRCFQLMESPGEVLLQDWMKNWKDFITFEVVPIISSRQMQETMSADRKNDR